MRSKNSGFSSQQWTSAAARRLMHLAGNPETMETAVKVVVAQLLDGISCTPTDLSLLAQRLKIVSICKEDIPTSGELRQTQRGFEIACATRSSKARDRFTIAHEMAHVVFEMTGPNPPRTGSELEKLCDMIATELLMPEAVFRERFTQNPTLHGWLQLAALFKSSLYATGIRCYEVGKTPVFEVRDRHIAWACGINNPLRAMLKEAIQDPQSGNRELRTAITDAINGTCIDTPVLLYNCKSFTGGDAIWRLQGLPIGSRYRAVFMLSPWKLYE